MNAISKVSRVTAAMALVSGVVYGQQPPDVVVSDTFFNTAMGTGALLNLTPSQCYSQGCANTAVGYYALYSNSVGEYNTASGASALFSNTIGFENTASGLYALFSNTSGAQNTAAGVSALQYNTTGSYNTAVGSFTMLANTSGNYNTGIGISSLASNSTGDSNTATGYAALITNSTGNNNTASGYDAMFSNTTGGSNTASGNNALYSNTTGNSNAAYGVGALYSNTTGIYNTANGYQALRSATTGTSNIAMGYRAGYNLTTGNSNIDIGNAGGVVDVNTIRIGTKGTQDKTYIAGIYDVSVTGQAVMVSASGQLGVVVSSERFKTAIEPMGLDTAKLQQLRPVKFHLKTDPKGALQYGLIAEEVAKVYPDLVVRDNNGRIDGVRYDELAPMLLNEVQQQTAEIRDLKKLVVEMQAGLLKLQSKDQVVARR